MGTSDRKRLGNKFRILIGSNIGNFNGMLLGYGFGLTVGNIAGYLMG